MADEGDAALLREHQPAIIGSAAVFLRPLRFMFDVETKVAVIAHSSTSTSTRTLSPRASTDTATDADALAYVHVHVTIATRPPLIERQQASGFLRAERASGRAPGEFDDCSYADTSNGSGNGESLKIASPRDDDEDGELRSAKGSFVWLLVRMQQQQQTQSRKLRHARVQYQVTPATESYLLPVEHTNVIKLLVTDELLEQIETKTLEFTFISPAAAASSQPAPAPVTAAAAVIQSAIESEARASSSDAKQSYRAELDTRELEHKAVAAAAASQQAATALEQERAQFQLRDLALQHEKSALSEQHEHERELLRAELLRREQQNEQLAHLTTQLEAQLQGKQDFTSSLQDATRKTDQAVELLKQRMAGDAKEREELQRRLRALEDEKLELLKKSRACTLQ